MRTIPVLSSFILFLTSLFVAMQLQKPLARLIILCLSLLTLWLEVSRPRSPQHDCDRSSSLWNCPDDSRNRTARTL